MATVDVTTMSWYDPTKSPDENYILGVAYYAALYPNIALQPDTGPDSEAEMITCYGQLRVKTVQVANKITTFESAKAGAFAAFDTQKDAERQALGTLWQAKEDADYDPDFVPA